jgi:hypothetical protein
MLVLNQKRKVKRKTNEVFQKLKKLGKDESEFPRGHTHPSHSQTSRLLSSSLSLGISFPRSTKCVRGFHLLQL